jgi:hypothetical protein
MIVIIVGTVVGTVLSVIAVHYVKVCLRKVAKKDRRYDLPSGE